VLPPEHDRNILNRFFGSFSSWSSQTVDESRFPLWTMLVPGLHVQLGLVPGDAVLRRGVARVARAAGHVPHLEQLVRRVVPDAVAERHGDARVVLSASHGLSGRITGVFAWYFAEW
jgi:hypothetical protein